MPRLYMTLVALLAVALVSAIGCTRESDPGPNPSGASEPTVASQPASTPVPISTVEPTATPLPAVEKPPYQDYARDTSCLDPLSSDIRNRLGKYVVRWSPDGSHILFNVSAENYSKPMDLYSVDAGGLRVRKVIDGSLSAPDSTASGGTSSSKEIVYGPTMYFDVSPDSSKVTYSTCTYYENQDNDQSSREYRYDIFVVDIDGMRNKVITERESIDIFPAWSPDGTKIAFVSEDHGYRRLIAGRLAIYEVTTGELSEVPLAIGDRVAPFAPAWSPDGRTIAFVAYDGDITSHQYRSTTPAVYAVGIDGSGLTRISTTSTRPSWSPDGRWIAFFAPYGEAPAYYSFSADGSEAVRIASLPPGSTYIRGDPAQDLLPSGVEISWAPDGSEILLDSRAQRVVADGFGAVEDLPVSFNAVSSRQTRNGSSGPEPGYPRIATWSPDGSRIAVGATSGIHEGVNVVLHTIDRDGTDPQALVRNGVTLVAEPGRRDFRAGIASCSAGTVIADPENNPGLVEDCKSLIRSRDELAGDVALNWGPGLPIEEWTGITVESIQGPTQTPTRRVTKLIIRWPSRPPGDSRKLTGRIPRELGGLEELQILDLRNNRLSGTIPSALADLQNLRGLALTGNWLEGCIPEELKRSFGTTLSKNTGLPYCG